MTTVMKQLFFLCAVLTAMLAFSCSPTSPKNATVRIKNYFNNPDNAYNPPWTIMKCSYRGVDFGKIAIGDSSEAKEVEPGLDYVLMVAAWDDTSGTASNCLPIASKIEEEVVDGQTRTIVIQLSNHQGPCPPEGVTPIPETAYDRILTLWPEYAFHSYADRALNPQCQ
jgi:hypothetical protein